MSGVNDLPPKENALFKRLRKCYEWKQYKQYKNGLKFAKQILSNPKFSEHAETLATKGLILSCLGKKEEAFELVRRGLRNNLKSHLCWHAYAILQRADRKYDEAIKCIRNALKWDKDNILYLRDLSIFQIQIRDLQGYRETRYQLLVLRPGQKVSWIGYAMTHHLTQDYDMALNVLEEFRKTQTVVKDQDYEHSELLSYQVWVMVEAGKYQEALEHLNKHEHQITDKLFVQETRGELLLKLGEYEKADSIYKGLLKRNPENVAYYKGAQEAIKLDSNESKEEMLRSYIKDFPRALTPKLLLLQIIEGDTFKTEVDAFLRHALKKGVPPTFKNLRCLYSSPQKTQILQELLLGYVSSLEEHDHFSPHDKEAEKEAPTSLLWTLYFLAQHYDHLHQYQNALVTIDKAILHTMTLVELYLIKAKIFKHMGNILAAVNCLEEAQSLDTADRYVNCKCTKYMLRAGLLEEAQVMASKFTREGTTAMENLKEMQCMWFGIEVASHYKNKKMYGEALKKCHEIDNDFSEIIEDQYEFHTYCMRKMTLRSYVELLRLEDSLRSHKFFFKCAKIAIEIYLHLHKNPLSNDNNTNDESGETLSAAEKKKLRNKQRKKEIQQQKQQQKQVQNNKPKNVENETENYKEEELVPDKLARPENALEAAMKFLRPLQLFSPKNIETQILAFKIAFQRGKLLLCLQAVKKGFRINPAHAGMHECIVQFVHQVSKVIDKQEFMIQELLKMEVSRMFNDKTAQQLNQEFIQNHCHNNLSNLLIASRLKSYLGEKDGLELLMSKMTLNEQHTDVRDCEEVYRELKEGTFANCEESMNVFKDFFKKAFPSSTILYPLDRNSSKTNASTNVNNGLPNGTNTSP